MANGEKRYAAHMAQLEACIQLKLQAKIKLLLNEAPEGVDDYRIYDAYRNNIRALIDQIKLMKALPNANVVLLMEITKATAKLLDGALSLEDYIKLANRTQGRGYPNAKILSGLMLAVGICAFSGILLTLLFTSGMVAPLVVGLVVSLIVYFGAIPMAMSGDPDGLSRDMLAVSHYGSLCRAADERHFDFFKEKNSDEEENTDHDDELESVASAQMKKKRNTTGCQ